MKGDPRRRGAFSRADALSLMSESARALGPTFDTRDFSDTTADAHRPERAAIPAPRTRRDAMAWVGRGTVAAAAFIAVGTAFSTSASAITTRRGEIRRVPLDDGSSIELNTETSVRVHYGREQRRIEVLYGEVFFTVTRNDRRPFLVDVGNNQINASLAAFSVRCLKDRPIDVLVDQGRVELAPARGASGSFAPVIVPPGTGVVVPDGASGPAAPTPQAVAPRSIVQQLAWREGKIAFEGERLDRAAAEFARYSDTRIVVDGPALAAEPITGLFAANDPVGFSRAIAAILDARVEQQDDTLVLRRPGRS